MMHSADRDFPENPDSLTQDRFRLIAHHNTRLSPLIVETVGPLNRIEIAILKYSLEHQSRFPFH